VERGPMPMPPAQRRIATDERPLRGLARGAHLTAEPRVGQSPSGSSMDADHEVNPIEK
jgi:hypothetical protein